MIYAQIDLKWNMDNVIKDVENVADMVLEGAAILVRDQARENVRPGCGPSPHNPSRPHPWIDTGNLMRDIQVGDLYREGQVLVREVGNTPATPYGTYLEAGWMTRGAAPHFVRWPWLWPALVQIVGDIRRMVQGIRL